jgi:hypothetical protein
MVVTGRPLVLAGITTELFVASQAVMVIAPLLVVKVNCARAATGRAKSRHAKMETQHFLIFEVVELFISVSVASRFHGSMARELGN